MFQDQKDGITYGDQSAWRHQNIGRLLNNALNRFETRVLEILAENGHKEVRYSHINLTRNLDITGTITTELARRAGMTKQAMGEIVEQCEQIGLVERVRDKRDARAKIVKFTKAGLEWLEAFRIALTKAEREMRDELGYLRTDAIASALQAYGRNFDQLGSESAQESVTEGGDGAGRDGLDVGRIDAPIRA
jgi:DNA-binding MarR family transcriptional regulator